MATISNPYQQYQNTQVQTAGPAQLTLMCYDGALRFLQQARGAMVSAKAGDYASLEVQSRYINKTQALLSELLSGLDFERGGIVATSLDQIYRYLYDRLTQANIHDDLVAIDEVSKSIRGLREAWAYALGETQAKAASPGAAAASPAGTSAARTEPGTERVLSRLSA